MGLKFFVRLEANDSRNLSPAWSVTIQDLPLRLEYLVPLTVKAFWKCSAHLFNWSFESITVAVYLLFLTVLCALCMYTFHVRCKGVAVVQTPFLSFQYRTSHDASWEIPSFIATPSFPELRYGFWYMFPLRVLPLGLRAFICEQSLSSPKWSIQRAAKPRATRNAGDKGRNFFLSHAPILPRSLFLFVLILWKTRHSWVL